MLRDVKVMANALSVPSSPPSLPPGNMHVMHLKAMANRSLQDKIDNVVENFRVAALQLSYMVSMPAHGSIPVLPDIPEDLDRLLDTTR